LSPSLFSKLAWLLQLKTAAKRVQPEIGSVLVRTLRHSSVVSQWGTFWEVVPPLLDSSLLPTCCDQPSKAEWAPHVPQPPISDAQPAPMSLHPRCCQEAWAKTAGPPGRHFYYSSCYRLLPGPAPSHQASATEQLGCWRSDPLAQPRCSTTWEGGKCEHWTLSHLFGRSPSNTCHMPPKHDLLLSLPSKQQKGSVRKRSVFQLHQRREYSH